MVHDSFARRMNLRPGDVVVVPKSGWNVIAHYVVYWKYSNGQHYYLENNDKVGVRWISETDFMKENPTYKRIRLFQGNEYQRSLAVERAASLLGTTYNLDKFNCENYANHVQYDQSFSKQVNEVKAGLTAAATVVGVFVLLNVIFD